MATGGSEFMSDEIKSIKCCLCLQENRRTDADKYCLDCKEYYCTSCVGIHQKFTIMKGHTIKGKADYQSTGSDRCLPSYPTQRCSQHPLEVISAYCKDHDEVACALCMCTSTLHRSCGNILSIPENIDDLYEGCNLNEIQQNISQTKKTMEEIKTAKENKTKELNKALNTEIEAVKALRQELEALLDNIEEESIQELRQEYSRVEASVREEIKTIESLLSSLNETASQLKKTDGNKAQQFVCVKTSQKLANKGHEIEKSQLVDMDETVFFTPDHCMKALLQRMKSLGNVKTLTFKHGLYKVKQRREINVKLANDSTNCSVWGSSITEDGYLLLADWNNKKLKRMDMSTEKVIDSVELQDHPISVCPVSKTEAAVALNNNSVLFVSLGNKMAATRTLTMNHKCFGLAHKDGKLFISDESKTVYIYDINGQQQQRLPTDVAGQELFTKSLYIAVFPSGNRVLVADENKGLVVLDGQGQYLSTHSYNNQSCYRAVCTDSRNVSCYRAVCTDSRNVFLSVHSTNKIVQIGPDFIMLGELEELTNISTLCFDHQRTRIIASVWGGDNIKILELE